MCGHLLCRLHHQVVGRGRLLLCEGGRIGLHPFATMELYLSFIYFIFLSPILPLPNPLSSPLPSFLRPPLFLPLTSSLTSQTFEGHETSVLKVTFATRGMQLVSSGNDGLVKVWTIRTNECATTLDGHSDKVRRVPSGREGRKGERERVPGRGGAGEGQERSGKHFVVSADCSSHSHCSSVLLVTSLPPATCRCGVWHAPKMRPC